MAAGMGRGKQGIPPPPVFGNIENKEEKSKYAKY
jgi:hypothetical protein